MFAEFDRRTFLKGAGATSAGVALAPHSEAFGREDHHPADPDAYITDRAGPRRFPLVTGGKAAPLVVSADDYPGVVRVVGDLQTDIEKVTGVKPALSTDRVPDEANVVLVGTIGRSPLIDDLVASGKLDVGDIEGKWETSLEQVVQNPMRGVRHAFVIAGSDQRGTIFGAYDVSRQSGVSPWYWWDDVPPREHDELYVLPGRHSQGTPAVKYRGFFINDENPALHRWAPDYFGPGKAPGYPNGFNSDFYAKVFETMLRLKANYLWPAVWGRAFAEDDPENHATATRYGIVMGTSHEAPMMRGIEEWNRHADPAERDEDGTIVEPGSDPYGGTGEWSFRYNADAVQGYWADGIRRMVNEDIEGVVTLGMRGPGDVSLPDGDGIELMENILASQRRILRDIAGGDITRIPQVQTLYKEVQRYWDKGLRPPDDVTVVVTDDNWGNLRKLPDQSLEERSGGYGLYYHYDYVGGGRNYKWVDTNLLPNIWDQLNQAYSYGIDRLWVVNVGDMKAMELPLQFFLDYAWSPDRWPISRLREWERRFAAQNFGDAQAGPIAEVLHTYAALQSRRKPELLNRRVTLDPDKDPATDPSAVVYDDEASPYSLVHYREIDRVTAEWQRLAQRAERIAGELPDADQDAYYQLVRYRVRCTANLYELRKAEFWNLLYAEQGRAATNRLADVTDARFADDQAMSDFYNNKLSGGKWNGFQSQPKIGYGDVERYGEWASWQQPQTEDHVALPDKVFPEVKRIELSDAAEMGVAIDGSAAWWPNEKEPPVLPTFSRFQTQPAQYIEVFNRGSAAFEYRIEPAQPWVTVEPNRGRVDEQARATVRIDWRRAPKGTTTVPITVSGPSGDSVEVRAVVENTPVSRRRRRGDFVEANGYVAMDAAHFSRAVGRSGIRWKRIPDIGRNGSGMEPFPVTAPSQDPGGGCPRLEYRMVLRTTGPIDVTAYLSPRNDVFTGHGLRYAVSIDREEPQVVDTTAATGADATAMNRQWERNTSDNVNRTTTTHMIDRPGPHVLTFWMVDPAVVVQRLVVDTGGLAPSYLGPPESLRSGLR